MRWSRGRSLDLPTNVGQSTPGTRSSPMPFAFLGLSLGLSAGIAPGPLLALVIERSLRSGLAGGLRVALAPLLTDVPIVFLAVWLIGRLPERHLDLLLLVGALFVIWLGVDGFRHAGVDLSTIRPTTAGQDLLHGALVNFLNPHPYLFWAAVGAPTVVRAWRLQPVYAVAFVLGFYLMLIGSKIALAFLFSRARGLASRHHRRLIQGSSLLLVAIGGVMLATAVRAMVLWS